MISRGSEYSGDHWLWREASLATDVASFLARAGARLLDDLDASALHVRVIDVRSPDEGDRSERSGEERGGEGSPTMETLAAIRRGVPGVTQPARGRHEISTAAAQRIRAWIDAGLVVHSTERTGPTAMRDLLRGLEVDEVGWWLIP